MTTFAVQCVVAFAATVAFAALFHVPRAQYAFCGIVGAAGWECYLAAIRLGATATMASFFAVLVLALLSRAFSALRRCPSTVFLICGIFPLVPGAGIYYTAYYFIMGDEALCTQNGALTFRIAVAISLGIVLVMALPAGMFNVLNPERRRQKQ